VRKHSFDKECGLVRGVGSQASATSPENFWHADASSQAAIPRCASYFPEESGGLEDEDARGSTS
jgi:hypothetical protein